ncbi:transcription factor adf-1 [Plakobranchus ocellatus]|uniref:Transcription factor adf-1 n=1 Tax=Plakobranchus ocellatus TaxID=259542 RepID=A0AAV4CXK7_9GAST|nr:transcription factor adf-1 [Plakobranchus ocellatus]
MRNYVSIFKDDEKLIEAVKKRPALYSSDEAQHKHRYHVNNAWTEIAHEVGHEVHAVKERWGSIRDYYRKKIIELRRIKAGLINKKVKKWCLLDQLQFLEPHLRDIDIEPDSLQSIDNDRDSSQGTCSRSKSYSDDDSERERLQMKIIKAENTDHEDEDIQSDDHYNRDVFQALNCGQGSLKKKPSAAWGGSSNTPRARHSHKANFESSTGSNGPYAKWQRIYSLSSGHPDPIPVTVNEVRGEIDTNKHFFTSLIPLVQTLSPLTAMEFRHEVHGVLLRYLKEAQDKHRDFIPQDALDSNTFTATDVTNHSNDGNCQDTVSCTEKEMVGD